MYTMWDKKYSALIWCIFHEDWYILDKATANQTLAMTKNVESTNCVKGVINIEVTNDNQKITPLLNNNWSVKSSEQNETVHYNLQDESMNEIHREVYFIYEILCKHKPAISVTHSGSAPRRHRDRLEDPGHAE